MGKPFLKQECPLAFVVLAWAMYIGAIPLLALGRQWLLAPIWIGLAPVLMWAYIKWFPSISPYMGYGRVDDRSGPVTVVPVPVTLYTAIGCPFCPIVKRRLHALQPKMGFQLREVDVTARPDILTRKGIWSVPVIEVGDRRFVGNATSEQLTNLISGRTLGAAMRSREQFASSS